jgi:acyl-coenzyme A thioesterase PaaI-like protein
MTQTEHKVAGRKQPNSRNCFACGLENPIGLGLTFQEYETGEVTSEIIIPEPFEGYPGIVHGGIIATMLDEIVSRAAMWGDHDHFHLTAKLELRFRIPVPTQTPILLRGQMVKQRGEMKVAKGEVVLPDGSVAAEAEAILAPYTITGESTQRLEALGWKVYPDDESS